ncbi:MAG: hypothetical protein JST59_02845 [Actinobacteria bacterium]|nr:hypothetical protein [Actinomycetota bacterium]
MIKLLDQAIYELKSIGEISVNLNPTKFFKSVFEMNDQQSTDFASVESFSGEVLQSPRFRPWLLNSTIRIILNCKRSVILEQICFVVNRIQMLTFQADFNSQKVI